MTYVVMAHIAMAYIVMAPFIASRIDGSYTGQTCVAHVWRMAQR